MTAAEEEHGHGLLFGEPVPAGVTLHDPVPSVTVGDAVIPAAPPGDGSLSGLVALGGLRVTWGTDEPLDQPPPATAQVSLMDFTRTWATTREVIGLPVVLSWTSTLTSRVFFRGRVNALELTRVQVRRPDGSTVPATRIDLDCTSLEVDLANRYPWQTSWPAETIGARATRLLDYVAGVADTIVVRDFWAAAQAAAMPNVNQTSIRDLLVQMFNSSGGDRMVYSPERRSFEWLGRAQSAQRSLQRLYYATTGTPRYGMGAFVGPDVAFTATGVDTTTPGTLYIDAADLEYDEGLTRQASSRITRAQVTSKDAGAGDAQVTTLRIDPAINESVVGQRAITLDSLHNNNAFAVLNTEDLLAMATQEGAAWRPGRLRWDVRKTGGFHQHALASLLLRGHQTGYALSINRSWTAGYGVRPLFRVTGGVITYEGGPDRGWVVDFDVAGFASSGGGNASPVPTPQHAITFEQIDDGTSTHAVCWWDDDHPNGMHETLTFEDLGYVGRGRGATTIGPDTGYDT